MERSDRQNLNLDHITDPVTSTGCSEQRKDRWLRIGLKAQHKDVVFNNLLTHVNVETLKEASKAIDGSKALGVDKVSKKKYGKNLDSNLQILEDRIHKGTYRPQPKREVLIPKANGKTRPIAIACFEDKLVDSVVEKILSMIYEPLFIRNSFGFRPRKSADDAIRASSYSLKDNSRSNVVEIDFSSFFNTIPHKKEEDARRFEEELEKRVNEYGLYLNKDKTKVVNFQKGNYGSFDFLGFTFYWGKQKKNRGTPLKVKTQKDKLLKSIREFDHWIKANRSRMRTSKIWNLAKSKLIGHYNYFGYWMNRDKLGHFYLEAMRSLFKFKWLNRRSQKISYTVEAFTEKLKQQPLPVPPTPTQLKQLGWNPYAN